MKYTYLMRWKNYHKNKFFVLSIALTMVFSMFAGVSLYVNAVSGPVGEITAPTAGERVSGDVTLHATYYDGDLLDTDTVFWAVRPANTSCTGTNIFGNVGGLSTPYTWDNEVFNSVVNVDGLADGDYCFVFNPNGNADTVREIRTFTVDNTAPELILNMPVDGSLHSGVIDLSATCNETCDYVNFWWTVDGEAFDSADKQYHYVREDGTDFSWSLDTLNAEKADSTFYVMEDGIYHFYAAAKDLAGNWTRSEFVEIEVDNSAPVVDISEPENGYIRGLVNIVGSVTDNVALSHYNLSLYPETTNLSDGQTHSSDRITDNRWCVTPTSGTVYTSTDTIGNLCTDWNTTTYEDGNYQIRLAARDAIGNIDYSDAYNGGTSSVHVIMVTIDNIPDDMSACKKGGWENYTAFNFRNQGDCVSYIVSDKQYNDNPDGEPWPELAIAPAEQPVLVLRGSNRNR